MVKKDPEIIKHEKEGRRYVNKDQYGIIGHAYPAQGGVEGGDSASWNGHYNYFSSDGGELDYVNTFEVGFGSYVRHPYKHEVFNRFGSYYKSPWDGVMSRDQLTGVLLGIIAAKNYVAGLRYVVHSMLRLFIFGYNTRKNGVDPNNAPYKVPDILGPDMWALMLRSLGPIVAYIFLPILLLGDLHLLINTLLVNNSDKDDKINYLGRLHVANNVAPTFIARQCVKLVNKQKLDKSLEEYWVGWRDNPGMYDLHSKAIKTL